jgi:integrator complex subunit 11
MLDCGMHMGYRDERRFPDFKYLSASARNFDELIDCVIVSHFHLDHLGALPYFTERCGYNGPIYMTYPTKAIAPILLDDFRKIRDTRRRRGGRDERSPSKEDELFFSSADIAKCMRKVVAVNVGELVAVGDDFEIRAYYAGHVLGAAMFWIRVGDQTMVYTGDFNTTPDRHLGGARIDKLRCDLLITESTYATTIRDSKRVRERDLLKRVHECVANGGKVLVPVFALGRAQELCILIDSYWERMKLDVPVYFSAGLTEKANVYYKLFVAWTNQKIKSTFIEHNMFDFKHIKPFQRHLVDQPGPMVLFASPGMLHSGMSLEVFKRWAGDPRNMVLIPGYCAVGTVGNRLLVGNDGDDSDGPQRVEMDDHGYLDVRCKVRYLSFSAHADAKGILQLVRQCQPRNVMLVHGEKHKMDFLKRQIRDQFNIGCFNPANGVRISIPTPRSISLGVSLQLLEHATNRASEASSSSSSSSSIPLRGLLIVDDDNVSADDDDDGNDRNVNRKRRNKYRLYETSEALGHFGLAEHCLDFRSTFRVADQLAIDRRLFEQLLALTVAVLPSARLDANENLIDAERCSLRIEANESTRQLLVSWSYAHDHLVSRLIASVKQCIQHDGDDDDKQHVKRQKL